MLKYCLALILLFASAAPVFAVYNDATVVSVVP